MISTVASGRCFCRGGGGDGGGVLRSGGGGGDPLVAQPSVSASHLARNADKILRIGFWSTHEL